MEKKSTLKSIFNIVFLFAITSLVLYFVLKDHFHEIMTEILHANLWWLCFGILLYILSVSIRSASLYKLTKEFQKKYHFLDSLRLSFMTQFFNAVTPFATGGQPFQVYHLKKAGVSIMDATNVCVQNFVVYQIALVALGILAVICNSVFHIFGEMGALSSLVALGFLINTIVIVFLFLVAFARKTNKKIVRFGVQVLSKLHLIKDREKTEEKWMSYLEEFYKGASLLTRNKKLMVETILLNFLGLCILYAVPLAVAFSMGYYESFNLFEAIIASSYVMLIGAFVPIPGGTGGLEYGFVKFYGNFVTLPGLNAMMLIWRFITYYFGMIVGAFALYIRRKK